MEYKSFEIYVNPDGSFNEAIVKTNLSDMKITNKENLDNIMLAVAASKGISYDELKSSPMVSVKLAPSSIKDKETEKETEKELTPSSSEPKKEDEDEYYIVADKGTDDKTSDDETKKEKNPIRVKNLVATITAITLIGVGTYALNKSGIVGKIKDSLTPKITDNTDYTIPSTYIETSDTGIPTENDEYEENMQSVYQNQATTAQTVSQVASSDVETKSFDDFMNALNDVSMTANANMFEISNFLMGSPIQGTAVYNNYASLFSNEIDSLVVKYFSDYRNLVVKNAYELQNTDEVSYALQSAYTTLTEFVVMGKDYQFTKENGETVVVNFLDLSPMARATVLNIAMALYTVNQDYTYNSEAGAMFPKYDCLVSIEEAYDRTVQEIEGLGFKK